MPYFILDNNVYRTLSSQDEALIATVSRIPVEEWPQTETSPAGNTKRAKELRRLCALISKLRVGGRIVRLSDQLEIFVEESPAQAIVRKIIEKLLSSESAIRAMKAAKKTPRLLTTLKVYRLERKRTRNEEQGKKPMADRIQERKAEKEDSGPGIGEAREHSGSVGGKKKGE